MKLKNLTNNVGDSLSKLIDYINNINFDSYKYNGNYIKIDENGFYINSFKPEFEQDIKKIIIDFIKKYWKDFESGIDFHRYDGNYFIEVKQQQGNTYNFTIESLDDEFYCKFNSEFVTNL